jgi:hypothetical protein
MEWKRFVCVFLLLAFLGAPLTACWSAIKTSNAAGLDDSIGALAAGGVAVMDDVTSTAPIVALGSKPSAMRFTRWQVRNLVAEANAKNGYSGSELDALMAPPAGAPPLSLLLGAWLTRRDGPLAKYAQTFMGAQDYTHAATIVFPSIVVLTFVADIARVTATSQATPTAFELGPWIASRAEADGDACTDIAGWVGSVVTSVTNAVQANGAGWLASIWNVVVTIGGQAFSIVVNGVLQSIVGFVTEIATVVGTLMQVASMFKPWTVTLAADPGTMTLGSAAVSGAFDATLNAQDVAWPATLVGCVKQLSGVDLTVASYKDAPVTWAKPVGIPTLAVTVAQDATLGDDKTAHYTYATIPRPPATDCPRLVSAGNLGITVTVSRTDVSKTMDSLLLLIANKLPAKLQTFLQRYEQSAVTAANKAIGDFKSPHATANAQVMELVADPLCTHTPPPGSTPLPTHPPVQPGHLPMATCDTILSNGDVAAGFPGDSIIKNLPPAWADLMRNTIATLMAASNSVGVSSNGIEKTPRVAQSTGCPIGPPYTPPAADEPDNPKIDALFVTLPPTGQPPVTASSDPACLAAMGPELASFQAECTVLGMSDSEGGPTTSTIVRVFSTDAEYMTMVFSSGGGAPAIAVMRSVLQRLNHP